VTNKFSLLICRPRRFNFHGSGVEMDQSSHKVQYRGLYIGRQDKYAQLGRQKSNAFTQYPLSSIIRT
jgi:hypothetical protein